MVSAVNSLPRDQTVNMETGNKKRRRDTRPAACPAERRGVSFAHEWAHEDDLSINNLGRLAGFFSRAAQYAPVNIRAQVLALDSAIGKALD